MRLYMFTSQAKSDLHAFAGDERAQSYPRNMPPGGSPEHSEPAQPRLTDFLVATSSGPWSPTVFNCGGRVPRTSAVSIDMESALVFVSAAFSTVNRIHFT